MLNHDQFMQAQSNVKHGLPVNMPSPEQLEEGIAALAAIIEPEKARTLEWRSRLRVTRERPVEFRLMVNECLPLLGSPGGEDSPWAAVADPLLSVPTFLPLAEAVDLLQSPNNPEVVLQRRRELIERHNAEADDRHRSTLAALSSGAAPPKFGVMAWQSVNPTAQLLLRLAYAFERDSQVASALVALANEAERTGGRFSPPDRDWWRDLTAAQVGG